MEYDHMKLNSAKSFYGYTACAKCPVTGAWISIEPTPKQLETALWLPEETIKANYCFNLQNAKLGPVEITAKSSPKNDFLNEASQYTALTRETMNGVEFDADDTSSCESGRSLHSPKSRPTFASRDSSFSTDSLIYPWFAPAKGCFAQINPFDHSIINVSDEHCKAIRVTVQDRRSIDCSFSILKNDQVVKKSVILRFQKRVFGELYSPTTMEVSFLNHKDCIAFEQGMVLSRNIDKANQLIKIYEDCQALASNAGLLVGQSTLVRGSLMRPFCLAILARNTAAIKALPQFMDHIIDHPNINILRIGVVETTKENNDGSKKTPTGIRLFLHLFDQASNTFVMNLLQTDHYYRKTLFTKTTQAMLKISKLCIPMAYNLDQILKNGAHLLDTPFIREYTRAMDLLNGKTAKHCEAFYAHQSKCFPPAEDTVDDAYIFHLKVKFLATYLAVPDQTNLENLCATYWAEAQEFMLDYGDNADRKKELRSIQDRICEDLKSEMSKPELKRLLKLTPDEIKSALDERGLVRFDQGGKLSVVSVNKLLRKYLQQLDEAIALPRTRNSRTNTLARRKINDAQRKIEECLKSWISKPKLKQLVKSPVQEIRNELCRRGLVRIDEHDNLKVVNVNRQLRNHLQQLTAFKKMMDSRTKKAKNNIAKILKRSEFKAFTGLNLQDEKMKLTVEMRSAFKKNNITVQDQEILALVLKEVRDMEQEESQKRRRTEAEKKAKKEQKKQEELKLLQQEESEHSEQKQDCNGRHKINGKRNYHQNASRFVTCASEYAINEKTLLGA